MAAMIHLSLHSDPYVISFHVGLGPAQWLIFAKRTQHKWRPGFCALVSSKWPCKTPNCPAGQRVHVEEYEAQDMGMKRPAGMSQPTRLGSLVFHGHCPNLRHLFSELQLAGLGLIWWKEKVCSYTRWVQLLRHCAEITTEGLESGDWVEGFRAPRVHQSPPDSMHSHPHKAQASRRAALASREAVLWLLLSIPHHSGLELWRKGTGHTLLKCLMGIVKSPAWTAKAGCQNFLSPHTCSEMV